jgi:hypothetical protein
VKADLKEMEAAVDVFEDRLNKMDTPADGWASLPFLRGVRNAVIKGIWS